MPLGQIADSDPGGDSRPDLGSPTGHEHRHVPAATGADQIDARPVDLAAVPHEVNGIEYVLYRQLRGARVRSAIRTAEIGMHQRPLTLLAFFQAGLDECLLLEVATPGMQHDQQGDRPTRGQRRNIDPRSLPGPVFAALDMNGAQVIGRACRKNRRGQDAHRE